MTERPLKLLILGAHPDDADPAVIQSRIDTYKSQSEPCLEYYRPRGVVKDIDGIGTIDDVFSRVAQHFGG